MQPRSAYSPVGQRRSRPNLVIPPPSDVYGEEARLAKSTISRSDASAEEASWHLPADLLVVLPESVRPRSHLKEKSRKALATCGHGRLLSDRARKRSRVAEVEPALKVSTLTIARPPQREGLIRGHAA